MLQFIAENWPFLIGPLLVSIVTLANILLQAKRQIRLTADQIRALNHKTRDLEQVAKLQEKAREDDRYPFLTYCPRCRHSRVGRYCGRCGFQLDIRPIETAHLAPYPPPPCVNITAAFATNIARFDFGCGTSGASLVMLPSD